MNRFTDREIEELLTPTGAPEPPEELLGRLVAEIPEMDGMDGVDAGVDADGTAAPARAWWTVPRGHRLRLAAAVVAAVGAGFLASRYLDERGEAETSEIAPPARALVTTEAAPEPAAAGHDVAEAEAAAPVVASRRPATSSEAASAPEEAVPRYDPSVRRLEEQLRALQDERAPRARKAPIPDPTPAAPGDAQVDTITVTAETPRIVQRKTAAGHTARSAGQAPPTPAPPPLPPPPTSASELRALGYLGGAEEGGVAYGIPEAMRVGSTGGDAEPNDAPYGDVFFESAGTNPFVDTEDDALSTFGLDVDTASYTVVRRYLRDGHLPPRDAVRVEEMVNFFDYGDPPPTDGADFALHAEGAPSPFGEGERYHLLRFAVRAREVAAAARPPATLVFVVDVSGSMAQENRLGLVQASLDLLLGELREDDRVGLVVYGSRGREVLEPTSDRAAIRRAVSELRPEGSTNAAEGLELGYAMASRHRARGRIHRVLLLSDGVANVGSTSADAILPRVRRFADEGIELTTVGFGMGNYNDVLMERLADEGNGRYAYVDTLEEAERIFVESLTGTLLTVAAEARAQVEFDPELVTRWRLLGYENRDIADHRFRDDTVDAGEIGAGHAVTVLYEVKLARAPRGGDRLATLRLRWGSVRRGEMAEIARPVRGADLARHFTAASRRLRLAAVVAELGEVLRGSFWARGTDLGELLGHAQRVSAEYPGDGDVAELAGLVARVAKLREERGE